MTEPTLKIGPSGYKLNPEKLKGAPQSILPYILGCFYFTEEFEYFDEVKHFLDIPEPLKSLDEISQELDEKLDKLIEQTKRNFYASKLTAENNYEKKFEKIFDNFEYAKKYGYFKDQVKWTINSGASNSNSYVSYEIGRETNNAGYYTIGAGIVKYYMNKKPNWLVRKCDKILLGFTWKDT